MRETEKLLGLLTGVRDDYDEEIEEFHDQLDVRRRLLREAATIRDNAAAINEDFRERQKALLNDLEKCRVITRECLARSAFPGAR